MQKQKVYTFLYIVFLMSLLLISAWYMTDLANTSYAASAEQKMDGMYPLNYNHAFHQSVILAESSLAGFDLEFYTGGHTCEDKVYVSLYNNDEKQKIGQWTYDLSKLTEEGKVRFLLGTELQGQEGKNLTLTVIPYQISGEHHASLCVSTDEISQLGGLYVNQSYKAGQKLICTFLTNKVSFVAVMIAVSLIGIGFAAMSRRRFRAPEKNVLLVLAIIGAAYFILIPMLQVPDELGHYYRSYEISQGDFLTPRSADGSGYSNLPVDVIPEQFQDQTAKINYDMILSALSETQDQSVTMRYSNATQALYAPVSYLPQAVGCLIGRMITNHSVVIFYMGRLFSFLTCILLVYQAVKIIPIGKRFLMLMVAMPMYLQQIVSLSSDALINALAFFLLAYVLALMEREGRLTVKNEVILAITCMVTALCKVVYLPLCFLVLLIARDKFRSAKAAYLYKSLVCGISALLNLGWLAVGFRYMIEFRPGVDTQAQIRFILYHVPAYLQVVCVTIGRKWLDWLGTMAGAKLCKLNVYTCLPLIALFLVMLFIEMLFMTREEENHLQKRTKVVLLLLFLMIFGLTLTSLYVQWTAYKNPYIEGFQGRYLIPILPLLAVSLKKWHIPIGSDEILKWELPVVAATNICALYSVYVYYL